MGIDLTIGMACHNDWQGVYFTVQSLCWHHAQAVRRCELIVADNDPAGQQGKWTREFIECWLAPHAGKGGGHFARVRYIAAGEVEGTSAPRERVFKEATGKFVLCTDCHVLLKPLSLNYLLDYCAENPESKDLLTGVLWLDDRVTYHTHMDDVWRDGMWGIWARAFRCPCGYTFCPREYPRSQGMPPSVTFRGILDGVQRPLCPGCGKVVQVTSEWWGHEQALEGAGFQPIGRSQTDLSFETPGHGLGLFGCRRAMWPGFNPAFRGFGGEEGYLPTKFRQRGGRCLCLPGVQWLHRFTRQGQEVPYSLNQWNKCRNSILGHLELGLQLDRVYEEYVVRLSFPQERWRQILAGVEWPPEEGHRPAPGYFARRPRQA